MMLRGLKIGDSHTGRDFDLIMTNLEVGLPSPKTAYVDVPSGNGTIDLTEALTGNVVYSDRKISAEFDMLRDFREWAVIVDRLSTKVHGRKHKIWLPDDPYHYYIGRVSIKQFSTDRTVAKLSFEATCEPFKYKNEPTLYNLVIPSAGVLSVCCLNSRKYVLPTFTLSAPATIKWKNSIYSLGAGTHKITNIMFVDGENELEIIGEAGTRVQIEYQEGAL